jgi:hypothetical protein
MNNLLSDDMDTINVDLFSDHIGKIFVNIKS